MAESQSYQVLVWVAAVPPLLSFWSPRHHPRPYSLIIFDAQQMRSQTELKLGEFRREFGLAATSYANYPRSEGNVFFCDLEFREAQAIFRTRQLEDGLLGSCVLAEPVDVG